MLVARNLRVTTDGFRNLPEEGPALLVCRYFHYLYDPAVLLEMLPRRPHLVISLTRLRGTWPRAIASSTASLLEWPAGGAGLEARPAIRAGAALLERGEMVAVFPEGAPTIDPAGSRKPAVDAYLPFGGGFLTMAALAQRRTGGRVPMFPVGFKYVRDREGWTVRVRIGTPAYLGLRTHRRALLEEFSARVQALST
ncbi:MAG: hypothetical protein GIW95_01155 [Candidatus Eremiobacteraeota bacterium]|nr:hypothetical protein [Candidatus Eremiobacteraeota bacterium]